MFNFDNLMLETYSNNNIHQLILLHTWQQAITFGALFTGSSIISRLLAPDWLLGVTRPAILARIGCSLLGTSQLA